MIKRALTAGGNGGGAANPSPFDDDFDGPDDVAPTDMNFSTSKLVRALTYPIRRSNLSRVIRKSRRNVRPKMSTLLPENTHSLKIGEGSLYS